MTADEAAKWAASRACKSCRKAEQPTHDGCQKAQLVAELIRRLAEKAK